MKYIRTYEKLRKSNQRGLNKGEPMVGDWVIVNFEEMYPSLRDEGNIQIGQIEKIFTTDRFGNDCTVFFPDWDNYRTRIMKEQIVYWSPFKEDLELILQAKKYNL